MQLDTPRRALSTIGLTPLINVVFLLLIFYMVAGTVKAPDPLNADLLQAAKPMPALPESMGRTEYRVQVPIRYTLN